MPTRRWKKSKLVTWQIGYIMIAPPFYQKVVLSLYVIIETGNVIFFVLTIEPPWKPVVNPR